MVGGKDNGGIQKFVLKTNKSNRFGTGMHGVQTSKKNGSQKKVPMPPLRKHKISPKQWFAPNANVFNHKKIQTPLPTPISVKTGDRVEKSKSTKQLEKIQENCMPNQGKTTMKCL